MSRQNKVNPGQYTQRGRLTQDDVARELKVQRRSITAKKSWQPASDSQSPPWEISDGHSPVEKVASGETEAEDRPASQTSGVQATPQSLPNQAKTARPAAAAAGKSAAKSRKPAAKAETRTKAEAPRAAKKAVLARNASKGSALRAAGQRKKKAGTTAKRKR